MVLTHMKNMLVTATAFYLQLLFRGSNVVALLKFMLATALLIAFLVDPVVAILISGTFQATHVYMCIAYINLYYFSLPFCIEFCSY